MNRLLLYVHYNKFNKLSEHVVYQLDKLRPLFSHILFISNSKLNQSDQAILDNKRLVDEIIQRENVGYDFAAWKDAMLAKGFENLSSFDSLTLMNDTCFGPLWDLKPIFEDFDSDQTVHFLGMTNHRETKRVKEHLQSYFIMFKREVIVSTVFKRFWNDIRSYNDVQEVIDKFETNLTTTLTQADFNYKVVFDTTNASVEHMALPDFSFYNPSEIIERRVPFLKVKAIDGNQHNASYILSHLGEISDYPIDMIKRHMSMMFLPTDKYLMKDKYIALRDEVSKTNKKIAIHLHTFYTDLLPEFLTCFKAYTFSFDLYLTTDSMDKLQIINEILKEYQQEATVKVTGNRGRDVLPMLKLKNELSQYDYVGHFHTKKSKESNFWAGESWRRELIDMLVKPANAIINKFDMDEHLGIVIADIPTYFRYVQLDPYYENALSEEMMTLWKKMNLDKDIDFTEFSTYVMSYGTYVWFRYDALKPLFDLDLTDNDVPKEPLPSTSNLHAIERMLVYIAWAQDYDFIASQNPELLPAFVDVEILNTTENRVINPYQRFDFTYVGGVKGALRYWLFANMMVLRYFGRRFIKRKK